MYSCVYLIRKVVEKKIFYKKKFMKCIFKYTRLYTNYILVSVKMTSLLWRSNLVNQSQTNGSRKSIAYDCHFSKSV